jgi:hypothetical protein
MVIGYTKNSAKVWPSPYFYREKIHKMLQNKKFIEKSIKNTYSFVMNNNFDYDLRLNLILCNNIQLN